MEREVNATIRTFNEMNDASWSARDQPLLSGGRPSSSAAQAAAVQRIKEPVRRMGAPPDGMSAAGALRKLCRGGGPGAYQDSPPALHGCGRKVPLPSKGAVATSLAGLLGGNGPFEMVEFFKTQRRVREEALVLQRQRGLQRAYTDPDLLRDHRGYDKLLRNMFQSGMLGLVVQRKGGSECILRPQDGLEDEEMRLMEGSGSEWVRECEDIAECGLFFVGKKNGELRPIVDGRCANTYFLEPWKVQLCSGDSLSRLELTGTDELRASSCDVRNAFSNMGLPLFLRNCFRLPRIKFMGSGWGKNFIGCSAVPRMRVLPMGFSRAVLFAQRILKRAALRAVLLTGRKACDFERLPELPRRGETVESQTIPSHSP